MLALEVGLLGLLKQEAVQQRVKGVPAGVLPHWLHIRMS